MSDERKPKKPPRKPSTVANRAPRSADSAASAPAPHRSMVRRLTDLTGGTLSSAINLTAKAAGVSLRMGSAFLKPEQRHSVEEAGAYLRELREVSGLTLHELNAALNLEDQSLLEAVERGTATLSFELILRLAAVVARHDPLPVVMRLTRSYNPALWQLLHDWGLGRVSLQYEREREFVNIYRRHDRARALSDQDWQHVLEFTRTAFDLALHFVENHQSDAESSA